MTHATRVLLVLLALWPRAGRAAETRAFWVWNRDAPLTLTEITAVRTGGVTRLYWHVGELVARPGGALAWRSRIAPPPAPEGLEIIPTVRLATELRSPELFTAAALAGKLAEAAVNGRVQVDYDCPDRLVPGYAERLRAVRAAGNVPWLSVTALAGWVDKPGFVELRAAADELCPMFYDLNPDPMKPLLDETVGQRLVVWGRACGSETPWLAGLPAFARVTLRDRNGRPRGHLRTWAWEDVLLRRDFTPEDGTGHAGRAVVSVTRATTVSGQPVAAGETLVARWPDPAETRQAVNDARHAGAQGIVLYRLPRPGAEPAAEDGPSLAATLGTLAPTEPDLRPILRLRREGDALVLENLSPDVDLPPRSGGYGLDVWAGGAAGWREAEPGEFVRVEKAGGANLLAAHRLFYFTRLPAGGALHTGLIQLAPGADPAASRWLIAPLDYAWFPLGSPNLPSALVY